MRYYHLITDGSLVIAEDFVILLKKINCLQFCEAADFNFHFFKGKKPSHGRVYNEAALFNE